MDLTKDLDKPKFIIIKVPEELQLSPEQFESLWEKRPVEPSKVFVYGKEHHPPRRFQSYGKDYRFSGRNHSSLPLKDLKILGFENGYLDKICYKLGTNQVLVNWYLNNQEYISFHKDDETQLVQGKSIFCYIFCKIARDVVIKCAETNKTVWKHPVGNNEGYVMFGETFQKQFVHGVPKRVSKPDRDERRISITCRYFKEDS